MSFQIIGLRKTGKTDEWEFELVMKDLENTTRGYTFTTKYGSEAAIREALLDAEVSQIEVQRLFASAG
jgi:hypothetical protein